MTISAHALQYEAEQAGSTLPPLLIDASRVATAVSLGSHGRRRAGPGDSFWQFRHYNQSDPAHSIDWRQTAKFGSAFVREREWDTAQTAAIWCDLSPSMAFQSSKNLPTKAERAAIIGLGLASLMLQGGEHALMLDSNTGVGSSRLALIQMAHGLERAIGGSTQADIPMADERITKNAAIVLASDFLFPIEKVEAAISSYSGRASTGHLLQILDPAEESLSFHGRIRFHGMEDEGSLLVERTEDIRADYIRRMANHRARLQLLASRIGWTFGIHHTDTPPHAALVALYLRMSDMSW